MKYTYRMMIVGKQRPAVPGAPSMSANSDRLMWLICLRINLKWKQYELIQPAVALMGCNIVLTY
ncbi:hypothetical protein [Roseovarius atlanticus]|uniref:hypothetical protein n=1 Tax=Roseovarius atlanticus TaxID=1641875 RepID=UPI001C97EF8B|nr:hypothetical protein [Roseovarius atlanticus]MBY5986869.1 hypothetical protein [Roseovarius atlanticus]MBY6125509.1 hypothetical protein [Roseovarius atlanticus]MBY6150030.1 hypothetical protein [Roseovarius atlanticus]